MYVDIDKVAIRCYTCIDIMAASTTKKSVAFRFNRTTAARLKQRAQETHAPQTALAERYIEEGLRHDEHPLIYFRDGATQARAVRNTAGRSASRDDRAPERQLRRGGG
jgi:hypothetical protein